MLTAQNSCGTWMGIGVVFPSAANLAKPSISEAKSVPALPKKYFTPIARSSSRYAWAVFSTEMVLRFGINDLPWVEVSSLAHAGEGEELSSVRHAHEEKPAALQTCAQRTLPSDC